MAACPGNRMHWDVTADYIASETDQLIGESKAVYDAVGALDSSAVTYDNVIKVFIHIIFTTVILFNVPSMLAMLLLELLMCGIVYLSEVTW